ncbi:hypothetical protein FQA39_LY13157 [Lamprigera yunnana]|nr:hypothetical protein FQA39_LY13157 [Lamprigera yunnana]
MEQLEKERRKENIVVQGVEINTNKQEELNDKMKKTFKEKLEVETKIKTIYRDAMVYINNDMTRQERDIVKKIRERAENEKKQGKKVKSGYQKLYIDKQVWKWNKEKGTLEQMKDKESYVEIDLKN